MYNLDKVSALGKPVMRFIEENRMMVLRRVSEDKNLRKAKDFELSTQIPRSVYLSVEENDSLLERIQHVFDAEYFLSAEKLASRLKSNGTLKNQQDFEFIHKHLMKAMRKPTTKSFEQCYTLIQLLRNLDTFKSVLLKDVQSCPEVQKVLRFERHFSKSKHKHTISLKDFADCSKALEQFAPAQLKVIISSGLFTTPEALRNLVQTPVKKTLVRI